MLTEEYSNHILEFLVGCKGPVSRKSLKQKRNLHLITHNIVIFEDFQKPSL